MKIIFLDIDGVLNCAKTFERSYRGVIGIDPYMYILLDRIIQATGAKIVLSSSWRLGEESKDELRQAGINFIDVTPYVDDGERGEEVNQWLCEFLRKSPDEQVKYAILDDDSDFFPSQPLFKTSWQEGLTEDISNRVIEYLNKV